MELVGDVLEGKYEILRVVGEGGMGVVYEATDLLRGHRVAVKVPHLHLVLDAESIARFEREAHIASRIGHENLVELLDTGRTADGIPYVVMELLEGMTLRELLALERRLPIGRAAAILTQTLSALQMAHDAGVVHRDLKPDNIVLIERDGKRDFVKLLDFGAARLLPHFGLEITKLTKTGTVLGTPHYMSPEQAAGAEDIGARSDIYAMGVILYEMVSGHLPYEAENYNALMVAIMKGELPDPRDIDPAMPEGFAVAIEIAAARRPEDRFGSCRELHDRLSPFVTAPDPVGALGERADRRVKRTEAVTLQQLPVGRKFDVIFVGLSSSSLGITGEHGAHLAIFPLEDPTRLVEALEHLAPRLIVASTSVDLQAVTDDFPVFRTAIVLVEIRTAGKELTVREWNAEHGAFTVSELRLAELDSEIQRLCAGPRPACLSREAIARIGFRSELTKGSTPFLIETEVRAGDTVCVRTTVWSEGKALDQTITKIEPSGDDFLGELQAAAARQHQAVVEQVARANPG